MPNKTLFLNTKHKLSVSHVLVNFKQHCRTVYLKPPIPNARLFHFVNIPSCRVLNYKSGYRAHVVRTHTIQYKPRVQDYLDIHVLMSLMCVKVQRVSPVVYEHCTRYVRLKCQSIEQLT